MTLTTTFDELAISAAASGKVSVWAALIDEAIELDRMDDVHALWGLESAMTKGEYMSVRRMMTPIVELQLYQPDDEWVAHVLACADAIRAKS